MKAALAIALLVAGCTRPPPAVSLRGEWPATPGRYQTVNEAWTRSGELHRDYQLVAEVHATFKSPEWRAAWIDKRAREGNMTPASREALEAEQRAADAEAWEVEIVLATWDRSENDLHRDRSVWRVVLVDADGNEVAPIEIVRDRRPRYTIAEEFPRMGAFSEAYVARFPRESHMLGDGVRRIGLRVSSTRGGIEVTWAESSPGGQD